MARKRHLASIARGFYCFCLMAQIEVQEVQGVQEVQEVQIRPIRLIRLIRGREEGPILFLSSYCHRTCLMTLFTAVHCGSGCSALRERLQCTAGAVAVHCT